MYVCVCIIVIVHTCNPSTQAEMSEFEALYCQHVSESKRNITAEVF